MDMAFQHSALMLNWFCCVFSKFYIILTLFTALPAKYFKRFSVKTTTVNLLTPYYKFKVIPGQTFNQRDLSKLLLTLIKEIYKTVKEVGELMMCI